MVQDINLCDSNMVQSTFMSNCYYRKSSHHKILKITGTLISVVVQRIDLSGPNCLCRITIVDQFSPLFYRIKNQFSKERLQYISNGLTWSHFSIFLQTYLKTFHFFFLYKQWSYPTHFKYGVSKPRQCIRFPENIIKILMYILNTQE